MFLLIFSLCLFVKAQLFCSRVCLYSNPVNDSIQFKMFSNIKSGYFSFGIGSATMLKSEMYIAWIDTQNVTFLQRRTSISRGIPMLDFSNDLKVNQNESGYIKGLQVVTFTRPKKAFRSTLFDIGYDLIESKQTIFSWAIFEGPIPSNANDIKCHTAYSSEIGNVYKNSSSYFQNTIPKLPLVVSNPKLYDSTYLVTLHGILMTLAWAFLAPAGVVAARFLKGRQRSWFSLHKTLLISASIISFAAFALVFVKIQISGRAHLYSYTWFGNTHVFLGILIVVLAFAQSILGYLSDLCFLIDS